MEVTSTPVSELVAVGHADLGFGLLVLVGVGFLKNASVYNIPYAALVSS